MNWAAVPGRRSMVIAPWHPVGLMEIRFNVPHVSWWRGVVYVRTGRWEAALVPDEHGWFPIAGWTWKT